MLNPIEVVLKFEQAINSRDPEAICSLMTADGEFIDSLGKGLRGAEKLRSEAVTFLVSFSNCSKLLKISTTACD